jgi:ribosomal small subunit protein bTHX
MGKGDKKTRKGKIYIGSFGRTRLRKLRRKKKLAAKKASA